MKPEPPDFCARLHIPQPERRSVAGIRFLRVIGAAAEQRPAVRRERERPDEEQIIAKLAARLAFLIPDPNRIVVNPGTPLHHSAATGGSPVSVRRAGYAENANLMTM